MNDQQPKEYKLIPLNEITDEAREIAVAWCENYVRMGFDIQQKHKLASDIMNYADQQVKSERNKVIDECIRVFDCNEYYYGDIVQSMLESIKIKQP